MKKIELYLLLIQGTLLLIFLIFTYSYVDLNLTITRSAYGLELLSKLQYVGYYERPTATFIYVILITLLFVNFAVNILLMISKKLSLKYLKANTLLSFVLLVPAYPFLSSDLFNYIFDARIVTNYHLNPYTHKPLDFPTDEWIRFMRWTHRYSPYGPTWILYSLIPSFLGFGKFMLTFLSFKLFIGIFHLLNAVLIYKILEKTNKNLSLIGTAFYALNPLFLIEGIVNAHNDIMHVFFVLYTVYALVIGARITLLTSIILGTTIKYLAILSTVPFAITRIKKINSIEHYIYASFIIYALFTIIFSTFRITVPFISSGSLQTQFQPWYLFWTLPLVALTPGRITYLLAGIVGASALFRYVPYLYYGEWSKSGTQEFMQMIIMLPILSVMFVLFIKKMYGKIF